MDYVTGTVLYIIIWWITLFMVLPWGTRPPQKVELGHAPSAPAKPHLGRKMLINTLLAALLWGGAYYIIDKKLVDLDNWSLVEIK